MAIKRFFKGIAIVIFMLLYTALQATAAPVLSGQHNNITNDGTKNFTVNISIPVLFSVTSNETNVTWEWSLNGVTKSSDPLSYEYKFQSTGTKLMEVYATSNSTGNISNTILWNVTVVEPPPAPPQPHIISRGNTKTNNSTLNIVINRTDSVTFNATANQTITTWNWYLNGTRMTSIVVDSFSNQFNSAGNHIVSVNASNANGTTDNTINWNIEVEDSVPPGNITELRNTPGISWIRWDWTNPTDFDFSKVMLYINDIFIQNISKPTSFFNHTSLASKTTYNLSLRPVDLSGNLGNWKNNSATTQAQRPSIQKVKPDKLTFETVGIETITFTIQMGDQPGNVTWVGAKSHTNSSISPGDLVNLTFTPPSKGLYNISVYAWNAENGSSDMITWNWTVRPTTYSSGNRIWDGSKPDEFALTYSWTPMSFSGFYYNAKDDVGNENITITLAKNSRTISDGDLVYTTSPQEVSFATSKFGKYQVIGFMAEKYFAGYTLNTSPAKTRPTTTFDGISAVGQGQLHKVLIDDDTKRTISVGGTIALQEGYVLKATDIDLNARTMLLSLLKDGNEVDVSPLSADETYVYTKKVGGVDDLPVIMVRFDNVFSGQELQVAFMKGLFQISDNPTIIKTGNKFRNMEVTQVNNNLIEMKNSNDIGLTKGTSADVMGDVKIVVADNESVLRYALSVDRTGNFEVRSTVYRSDDANPIREWTPYNFGMNIGKTSIGFFYDLDDGIGSERMNLTDISGRSIPDKGLTYSTSPEEVKFTYTDFGKYQVIGFMADKYFAGYTSNTKPKVTRPNTDFDGISSLANGALHKVLVDDDTKKTISVGGTIALKEGYVIKATDIDLNARTMLLSLMKDGSEVDLTPLSAGETYVYTKTVGGTENLPLIMVRFENVFSGQELQVAFLKGIFQISDTPTVVKVADQFGKMEVRSVSASEIKMSNDGSIGLDKNKNDQLMGNLRLKTADNDKLRFYFAVDVTADMIQNQLAIDAPTKAMAGDTIKIKVKAGGAVMDNATINIGTETGTTDKDGVLNFTLPRELKGTYPITASKTGYEKATQNIEIEKYVDYRLSIEAPSQANQYETITIKVLYNGTVMSGATVLFDNGTIGTSDSNGDVTYKLETSGTHSISASKKSYITVTRDIEIRAPYSEFKGLDINITPNPGFAGEAFLVRSNITNVGTMNDSYQVELIVNGTAVDNKTITLGAGEKTEVNFTRIEKIPGNVTVEVMGQSMLYEAKEKPTNYLLIGGIATGIGIIAIYILTSKGILSLELLKQKFNMLLKK